MTSADSKGVRLLFTYGFGNAAAYMLTRTVADSYFLAKFGSDRLPQLFLLSALAVAFTSVVYSSAVARFGLRKTIVSTLLIFALASIVLAFVMQATEAMAVLGVTYVLAQIRGSLGTIQFATVLNEQFGSNKPERVVGIVGSGATLAGFVVGLGVFLCPTTWDLRYLLLIAATIDLVTILPLLALRAIRKNQSQADNRLYGPPNVKPLSLASVRRNRYVLLITMSVSLAIVATTLVEFQWKAGAADQFANDPGRLARYFGLFYGILYLITGMLQVYATSFLLRRGGIYAGLLVLPVSLLIGTITTFFAASQTLLFTLLTLTKGADAFRRSLFDPSIQVIYSPVRKDLRRQAITFVSGVAKPLSEAIAAALIILLSLTAATKQLALILLVLCALWILFVTPLAGGYLRRRALSNSPKTE